MKKFRFDFSLDIWMQDIDIEAETYDEALHQLTMMAAEEIVKQGYVKDYSIKDLDCEEIEDEK